MDPAETRYVEVGGSELAYQVIGSGEHELLVHYEINGHLDLMWTDPYTHATYERFAPLARMVVMQRRGFGLSGHSAQCPTIEEQAEDILAVMDAVGFERVTLMGMLTTCAPVALVAARVPHRVKGLLLVGPIAAGVGSSRAVENGWPPEVIPSVKAAMLDMVTRWGSGLSVDVWDADQATPYNRRMWGLMERASATPTAARAYHDYLINQDFSEIFASVTVPTRVLRLTKGLGPESVMRRVADLIPDSELRVLPPTPRGAASGEAWVPIFDNLLEMATGDTPVLGADSRISSVLFTDIVDSTGLLGQIGDLAYRELRDQHERDVRLLVEGHAGRLVNVSGDGTLSVFANARDAVECAGAISAQAKQQNLRVRAGVHTGELQPTGMDITGMTVHVGARIAALADGDEILISRLVKDLLLGSDIQLEPRGTHELKGVVGHHDLYAVVHGEAQHVPAIADERLNSADRLTLQLAKRTPQLVRGLVTAGNAWQRLRSARA